MEDRIIQNNYEEMMYGFPLVINNFTKYQSYNGRRGSFIKLYCDVYFGEHKIISLDRHWRPGEKIKELAWLKVFKEFVNYCKDPVKFQEDQPVYHTNMKDYWCFEHQDIYQSFQDFVSVQGLLVPFFPPLFKTKIDWITNFNFNPTILEDDWANTFKSEMTDYDLIVAGFISFTDTDALMRRIKQLTTTNNISNPKQSSKDQTNN